MHPNELFDKLFAYYGPQNWWPGEGFEIAIGAILTQNTSWKNVETALENLRKNDLLTPINILQANFEILKKLIAPSGFFNQKAQYLLNLCKLWVNNNNPTREELLAVKGIGEETADSILLYLLNQPEFVIDAYTVRISNRLGLSVSNSKKYWKDFYEAVISKSVSIYNEFHALFVIHAKTYCKKNTPDCFNCFLEKDCSFGLKASI
ncbi:MAG: endonuclease [Asgard group archaeon]|nr:endonuclease [Asgard group archaeon]